MMLIPKFNAEVRDEIHAVGSSQFPLFSQLSLDLSNFHLAVQRFDAIRPCGTSKLQMTTEETRHATCLSVTRCASPLIQVYMLFPSQSLFRLRIILIPFHSHSSGQSQPDFIHLVRLISDVVEIVHNLGVV